MYAVRTYFSVCLRISADYVKAKATRHYGIKSNSVLKCLFNQDTACHNLTHEPSPRISEKFFTKRILLVCIRWIGMEANKEILTFIVQQIYSLCWRFEVVSTNLSTSQLSTILLSYFHNKDPKAICLNMFASYNDKVIR